MKDGKMTKLILPQKYGRNNIPENPLRCIKEVWANFVSYQCQRKRGFGPGGLYCKQHNPIAIKAKEKIEYNIRRKHFDKIELQQKRIKILLKMAEGIPTNKLCCYKMKFQIERLKSK